LIPTPIRQVLSTFQKNGVQALLMGGQACIFYGAAQVSKDVDFVVLAEPANFNRLEAALGALGAHRIDVPRFDPALLARGHAVHFRCSAPGVEEIRIDLMTRLRDLPEFPVLWGRRTIFEDQEGTQFHLLSIPDLVQAKKTQRSKDWPVIELLVAIHHRENQSEPNPDRVAFWLREARTPELICQLVNRFPDETQRILLDRPLLNHAIQEELEALRAALDTEVRAEQAKDRIYWEPLRREIEAFRRAELQHRQDK
jgi:hypothetical protein